MSFLNDNREVYACGQVSSFVLDENTPGTITINSVGDLALFLQAVPIDECRETQVIITPQDDGVLNIHSPDSIYWKDWRVTKLEYGQIYILSILHVEGQAVVGVTYQGSYGAQDPQDEFVVWFGNEGYVGWIQSLLNPDTALKYVEYGTVNINKAIYRNSDKMIVAVGSHAGILYGRDPSRLSIDIKNPSGGGILRDIVCRESDGMLFAVGDGKIIGGTSPSSLGGLEGYATMWNQAHCRKSDGMFLAVGMTGQVAYGQTAGGVRYQGYTTDQNLRAIASQPNGTLLIGGTGQILYGTDPANLTVRNTLPGVTIRHIIWSDKHNYFIVVGENTSLNQAYWYYGSPTSLTLAGTADDAVTSVPHGYRKRSNHHIACAKRLLWH